MKVLMMEDNHDKGKTILREFPEEGVTIEWVHNYIDFLDAFGEADWDIIILDNYVPENEGYWRPAPHGARAYREIVGGIDHDCTVLHISSAPEHLEKEKDNINVFCYRFSHMETGGWMNKIEELCNG